MIRAATVLLLLTTACTVPSLEELYGDCDRPLTPDDVTAPDPADAVLEGENSSACQAVKLTINTNFRPGCVRVLARSITIDSEIFADIASKGRNPDAPLIVAVIPPAAWGRSVTVEAQAFEQTCVGTPVVTFITSVTLMQGVVQESLPLHAQDLDGDGYVSRATGGTDCADNAAAINPGALERCNNTDDNCNGVPDTDEFQLGQACTAGNSCPGTHQCGANGAVVCGDIPSPTMAYPDIDGDGHGDWNAAAVPFCGAVPADYVVTSNDDCDDTRSTVYTGAQERCDGEDNDCDGTRDDGFNVGAACTPTSGGFGELVCAPDGTGTECQGT